MNHHYRPEIEKIMESLTRDPSYKGYIYDPKKGFFRGPLIATDSIPHNLAENQAIIGIRQPISRFPQRHTLLVEITKGNVWKLKDILDISEG